MSSLRKQLDDIAVLSYNEEARALNYRFVAQKAIEGLEKIVASETEVECNHDGPPCGECMKEIAERTLRGEAMNRPTRAEVRAKYEDFKRGQSGEVADIWGNHKFSGRTLDKVARALTAAWIGRRVAAEWRRIYAVDYNELNAEYLWALADEAGEAFDELFPEKGET